MREKPGQACNTLQANTWAIGAPHKLTMSTSGAKHHVCRQQRFRRRTAARGADHPHAMGSSITFNVQDLNGNPVAAGSGNIYIQVTSPGSKTITTYSIAVTVT